MFLPFWTIRVTLIILLWPVADLPRMRVVTLASLMIVMRPFIPFFLGHIVRGLLHHVVHDHRQAVSSSPAPYILVRCARGDPADLGLPLGLPCARQGL
jgi:hypothetical protein